MHIFNQSIPTPTRFTYTNKESLGYGEKKKEYL